MAETSHSIHLAVAAFPKVNCAKGRQQQQQWSKLVSVLCAPKPYETKETAPLWSPTLYRGVAEGAELHRKAENVASLSALVFDIDDGTAPSVLWPAISPYEWAAHTTWQHTKERPRYRIVFPLAAPVAAETWRAFYACAVQQLSAGHTDPVCKDTSRIYFLPAHPLGVDAGPAAWGRHNPGRLLAAEDLAAEMEAFLRAEDERPVERQIISWPRTSERPTTAVLLEKYIGEVAIGRRNANGFALAIQLRDCGYSENTAESVLRDYARRVPQGQKPYTEREAVGAVKSAYGHPAREPWPTREPFTPPIATLRAQQGQPTSSAEPRRGVAGASHFAGAVTQVAADFGAELELRFDPATRTWRAVLTVSE